MKIFLAAIVTLVFVFSSFGQEVAKDSGNQSANDEKLFQEVKDLFKDAQSDFSKTRGKILFSNAYGIGYQPAVNHFQSYSYSSEINYYIEQKKYDVRFAALQANSTPYKKLIELLTYAQTNIKQLKKVTEGKRNGEDYITRIYYQDKQIAYFENGGETRYIHLFSNPPAWLAVNNFVANLSAKNLKNGEKSMDELIKITKETGLDKTFEDLGKNVEEINKLFKDTGISSAKSDVSSNYTNLLNQCEENLKKEDYVKTVEVCSEAIKLNPNDAKPLYARGTAYYFLPDKPMTAQERLLNSPNKNKRLAITDLELATKLDPKNADYFYALGMAQLGALESDKMDAAARSFTEVLRLNSSDPDAHFYRAEANRIHNNPSESLEDSINKTHKSRERKQSAITDYTTYLQTNPNNANGLIGRGLVYIELGLYDNHNYELGIADLTKVINQGKNNEKIYLARGTAYIETGKFLLALDDLNKALQLHDSVKQPQWDLAREEILSEIERAKKGKN